jgi:hypothetical protein
MKKTSVIVTIAVLLPIITFLVCWSVAGGPSPARPQPLGAT